VAALVVFIGQSVQGDWMLSVRGVAGQDVGKLNRWSLEFFVEGGAESARGEAAPNLQIPDNNPAGVSSDIAIARPGSASRVKVSIDITHTYVGDLRIELVSPAGRSVVLHGQLGGDQDNLVVTYDSAAPLSPLSSLIGQPMQGNWVLRVADLAAVDVGTLNKWSLELIPVS
jgi:subtilisin-like proprotein convertase family protein